MIMALFKSLLDSLFGSMREATLEEKLTTVGRSEVEHELHNLFLETTQDSIKIDELIFDSPSDLWDNL